jgi:hypothetical protein
VLDDWIGRRERTPERFAESNKGKAKLPSFVRGRAG